MTRYSPWKIVGLVTLVTVVAVSRGGLAQGTTHATGAAQARTGCDHANGGLTLPPGFCASVFADNLGRARHLTIGRDLGSHIAISTSEASRNLGFI